ncbi:hypothetical protein TWF970_000252 [Orbilia oligospora]|uniref:Uncharacterized protein n=1 Tax=Orbilia oligospora TaxID=2813651 RepID=A0A7C8RQ27_ORBOL|nr:hypothetical protein TWF970_000252 [Orbilia oligospora]
MSLRDADKKLTAIYKLTRLEYNPKSVGSRASRRASRMMRYLQEAEEILNALGPDYDEVVTLAVVRGIDREELKETIAAMVWNQEWNLDTVSRILRAAFKKEVWDFDRYDRLAITK